MSLALAHKQLSEKKPDLFTHNLKFILLPQLIVTTYACSLPPLANVDWSTFPECFLLTMKTHDWCNDAKEELKFGFEVLIWFPLSVHICLRMPCSGLLALCRCIYTSKLFYTLLFVSFSLFKLLQPPTPPRAPPIHPLIYTDPILMKSMKIHQKLN